MKLKSRKQILSALAALAVLSAATGATAFAASVADKEDTAPAVTAEVAEETEAEAPAADADAPAADAEAPAADAEAPAPVEEAEKPAKPIGKHEVFAMITKTFDLETFEFKDADAKAEWVDFCQNTLKPELEKEAEKEAERAAREAEKAAKDAEKAEQGEEADAETVKPEGMPQAKKASFLIVLTLAGMWTASRFLQYLNASCPISSRLSGSETVRRFSQS